MNKYYTLEDFVIYVMKKESTWCKSIAILDARSEEEGLYPHPGAEYDMVNSLIRIASPEICFTSPSEYIRKTKKRYVDNEC